MVKRDRPRRVTRRTEAYTEAGPAAGARGAAGDATRRTMDALRRLVRALSASARGGRSRAAGAGRARATVSGAQLFVLRQIALSPGLSLGALAARTLTGQSTVSEVVARLADAGLVARSRSADDGRLVRLTPTASGRRAIGRAGQTAQERLVQALGALGGAQREALAGGLESWLAAAGLAGVPATMFFEGASVSRGRAAKTSRVRSTP